MTKPNESLRTRLLEFLAAPKYQPLKEHELMREFDIRADRGEFRAMLRELEREGRIALLRKNRWALARETTGIRGRLRINLQGHGYVTPQTPPNAPALFIHRDSMGNALDGDTVLIEPLRPRRGRGRMFESAEFEAQATDAKIVRVLERKRSQVVGLLQQTQKYWYVIPDSPRITQNIRVSGFAPMIKLPRAGRKVVITLEPSSHLFEMLSGTVTEDLGEPNAPGVDVVSILRDRELNEKFPDHVQQAADARPVALNQEDTAGRRDLRSIDTVTIDPVDAKDFDDAVSLLRIPDGTFKLYVHIADVAHFVPIGSEVDREALNRGNSVYMVDRHVPMLPKHLTADVCSLRPHSDRLAHTVIADLAPDGSVLRYETCRSVIHSKLRLNYEQVQDFIDRKSEDAVPPPLRPMLRDMIAMSDKLRSRRMNAGALDLAMPEVKIQLDKLGRAVGINRRGASEAYHVVEEFMLVANVCVAKLLASRGVPTLYRIHEMPSDEQWEKMSIDLGSLGISATPHNHEDLNRIVRQVAGTPLEYPVNLAVLKNLKRALYSCERDIHFGLAFDSYVHFTSPIRRYADLVVHRGLCALENKQRFPYSADDCANIAQHVSDTERTAAEAEQESLDVKRVEFYANALAAGEVGPHRAIVSGFVSRGLIVETLETLQRGLLAYASLNDDFYEFDPKRGSAQGRHHKKRIRLGDEVSVILARVDTVKRLIDFAPAEGSTPTRSRRDDRRGRGKSDRGPRSDRRGPRQQDRGPQTSQHTGPRPQRDDRGQKAQAPSGHRAQKPAPPAQQPDNRGPRPGNKSQKVQLKVHHRGGGNRRPR